MSNLTRAIEYIKTLYPDMVFKFEKPSFCVDGRSQAFAETNQKGVCVVTNLSAVPEIVRLFGYRASSPTTNIIFYRENCITYCDKERLSYQCIKSAVNDLFVEDLYECIICLDKTDHLFSCDVCGNKICEECVKKLDKMQCPYCRKEIEGIKVPLEKMVELISED